MTHALEVERLTVRFGAVEVIRDLSFSVPLTGRDFLRAEAGIPKSLIQRLQEERGVSVLLISHRLEHRLSLRDGRAVHEQEDPPMFWSSAEDPDSRDAARSLRRRGGFPRA